MKIQRHRPGSRAGFSLIELVVVVLIMTVLAGVVVPRVMERQMLARDARRLADIKGLQEAIEQYFLDTGQFPAADTTGWNRSTDAGFISVLVDEGYIREPVRDPLNDNTYQYRYRTYAAGQFGCVGTTRYYVLGIRNFENADFAAEHVGYFKCATQDFGTLFDYVTGGGASFQ